MNTFSDIFKYLRRKHGETQESIAAHLGLSKSTISMYEVGKRTPNHETLELIADYFNVSLDFLIGRESNLQIDENTATFVELFSKLTAEQQVLIIQQIKGILSAK